METAVNGKGSGVRMDWEEEAGQKEHHASREITVPYYLECELSRVLHSKQVKREKLNLK